MTYKDEMQATTALCSLILPLLLLIPYMVEAFNCLRSAISVIIAGCGKRGGGETTRQQPPLTWGNTAAFGNLVQQRFIKRWLRFVISNSLPRTKNWVENEILEERRDKTRIFLFYRGNCFSRGSVEGLPRLMLLSLCFGVTFVFVSLWKRKKRERCVRSYALNNRLLSVGNEKPIGNEKELVEDVIEIVWQRVAAFCVFFLAGFLIHWGNPFSMQIICFSKLRPSGEDDRVTPPYTQGVIAAPPTIFTWKESGRSRMLLLSVLYERFLLAPSIPTSVALTSH